MPDPAPQISPDDPRVAAVLAELESCCDDPEHPHKPRAFGAGLGDIGGVLSKLFDTFSKPEVQQIIALISSLLGGQKFQGGAETKPEG